MKRVLTHDGTDGTCNMNGCQTAFVQVVEGFGIVRLLQQRQRALVMPSFQQRRHFLLETGPGCKELTQPTKDETEHDANGGDNSSLKSSVQEEVVSCNPKIMGPMTEQFEVENRIFELIK